MKLSDENSRYFLIFIHTLHSETTTESYILFREIFKALENRSTFVLKILDQYITKVVINYLFNKKDFKAIQKSCDSRIRTYS